MRTVITCCILMASISVFSQEEKNAAVDTTSEDSIKSELASIKKLLLDIQKRGSESDTLASLHLVASKVMDSDGTSHIIEKVQVFIENGMFQKSRLYTKGGRVFETNNPLHLQQLNKYASKSPFKDIRSDSLRIKLLDVLVYLPELDNLNYAPEDNLYELSPQDTVEHLAINTDLNSYIDYRIYSDLLGLLDEEGNGLIQTEISSTITYNSFPIGPGLYLANYIKPTFKISKFDSEFRSQVVPDQPGLINLDRLKFNQLAFLELGVTVNLIKINLFQHSFDILNTGAEYKYSKINFEGSENTMTINSAAYFFEQRAQFMKYKNFGFEYALQIYFQNILNSNIRGYSERYEFLKYEFSLFYHPKNDHKNMIFLRFQSFNESGFGDFFTQLQFGYKSQLKFK